ncbi:hypothetical protein Ait01nite_023180 [Actinoplanes italicus]|nr:hypothetical protein Ait01nite_023180 [Actinoplanes italicus]
MVPLTEPLTDFPLPASGGSRAVVVRLPFSGTPDERSTASPDDTVPGSRPSHPAETVPQP